MRERVDWTKLVTQRRVADHLQWGKRGAAKVKIFGVDSRLRSIAEEKDASGTRSFKAGFNQREWMQ